MAYSIYISIKMFPAKKERYSALYAVRLPQEDFGGQCGRDTVTTLETYSRTVYFLRLSLASSFAWLQGLGPDQEGEGRQTDTQQSWDRVDWVL